MSQHATIVRESLNPGDIGEITRLHGEIYSRERGYGVAFESYVAEGLAEFHRNFDAARDRIWLYESNGKINAMLFLMHRGQSAQLRYFLTVPELRGSGLGKDLMRRYMDALRECGYQHSFLWTTDELQAAASLYVRHGFVVTERAPSTRFGKELAEVKYEWRPSW